MLSNESNMKVLEKARIENLNLLSSLRPGPKRRPFSEQCNDRHGFKDGALNCTRNCVYLSTAEVIIVQDYIGKCCSRFRAIALTQLDGLDKVNYRIFELL